MNPTINKILHGVVVTLFLVGGLGATLTGFKVFTPPDVYNVLQDVVTVCSGLTLYAMSSPFLQPFLPVHTPAAIVGAAVARAVREGAPIDDAANKFPGPAKMPPGVFPLTCLALCMMLAGCAWFKANAPTVESDLSQDGLCVLAQAVTGEASAASIATECGIPAVSQVVAIVAKLIVAYSPTFDAGSGVVGARALTPAEVVLLGRLRAIK